MKPHTMVGAIFLRILWCGLAIAAPPEIRLAEDGTARFPVVIAPQAGERERAAADELAVMLERMTDARVSVMESDGTRGLAVGRAESFPALDLAGLFDPSDRLRREEYLLRTHPEGAWLVGATDLAVEHAVWDFLYRLGFRQFFPGETWEVIPHDPAPGIAVDALEKPAFLERRGGGTGLYPAQRDRWETWRRRNRYVSGVNIITGHAYGRIIRRHREVFEAHPEFLALVDGERQGSKLCISNPDLRQFVVDYAVKYFREHPGEDSLSMEPSDGGGWCECDACAALGETSDRVVVLANAVAEAVNALDLGPKWIGILAYHLHTAPPAIDVHPEIVARAVTHSLRFGYRPMEVIEGWSARGASMAINEVYNWGQSAFPARQKGSDLVFIRESLPRFHAAGIRFFSADHSDGWGATGLGMLVASRILWDLAEADRTDAIVADFLQRAFGKAHEPMAEFFDRLYLMRAGDQRPLLYDDLLGRMYRLLARARQLDDDPGVRARIDHLILFTRYADLHHRYTGARGAERQTAFDALLRHAWRIRDTHMVPTRIVLRTLPRLDSAVEASETDIQADERVYGETDIETFLREGIARYDLTEMGFRPIAFSEDLVPSAPLHPPDADPGNFGRGAPRGRQQYYTWLNDPGDLPLTVTGGFTISYPHLAGNVRVSLFADAARRDDPVDMTDAIPPDREPRVIVLSSPHAGLHRLDIAPAANSAMVEMPDGMPRTMSAGRDPGNRLMSLWSLVFYVPRGTQIVGGYSERARGQVLDGEGTVVYDFSGREAPAFFKIPVPPGQDGQFWKFNRTSGRQMLLTVPPYLARTPAELLIPREVVDADAAPRATP